MNYALLASVFVIASCGLVYELIAGTLASYLLGDSVTQFSTVIGTYLFAMGIGSWLSKYLVRGLVARFVQIELMVGLVGGFSAAVLFVAFSSGMAFRPMLYVSVVLVGTLVGLEIPLLLRILRDRLEFRDLVAQVLTLDYIGALAASLAFPLVLVPKVGLVRSALLFGLLNAAVALWSTYIFAPSLGATALLRGQCAVAVCLLVGGVVAADRITEYAEGTMFSDEIILARSSPYQRIVVTRWKDDVRLYLNNHLQFASRDEYRYHEALVHPGLASIATPRRVLVLGGGDGLAVREVLRYPSVESVKLVDLDPEMIRLARNHELFLKLNGGSLNSPKVTVVNEDAFKWLENTTESFDFAIVDLPDPNNYSLGKLYTNVFYRRLKHVLGANGLAVVQSTSPLFARKSFWCIAQTMKSAGLDVTPYHVYVPSFGEWGYVLASSNPYRPPQSLPPGLKYLDTKALPALFEFPVDMAPVPVEVNRLNNQILVQYYEAEWHLVAP
ncbi:MAG: polyamine aminopropyltransferase [Candidatus Wallbacteria bacterium]|nr:polyamine aminopropyltransferase [Candidatus Wallbacteria bacterium]